MPRALLAAAFLATLVGCRPSDDEKPAEATTATPQPVAAVTPPEPIVAPPVPEPIAALPPQTDGPEGPASEPEPEPEVLPEELAPQDDEFPEPAAQARGPIPRQPEDTSVMDLVEEADERPPQFASKPRRLPAIDRLFDGLPDQDVPPWLRDEDTFGWAKLNNALNRRMPMDFDFVLDVEDVTVEPTDDGLFVPTLHLEQDWGGSGIHATYMNRECQVGIRNLANQYNASFDVGSHRLLATDEAGAERLLGLKGRRVKLVIHATKVEVTSPNRGLGRFALNSGRGFAPIVGFTAAYVEVVLPEEFRQELGRPRAGGHRAKCPVCRSVFTSPLPPDEPQPPNVSDDFRYKVLWPLSCPACQSNERLISPDPRPTAEPLPAPTAENIWSVIDTPLGRRPFVTEPSTPKKRRR